MAEPVESAVLPVVTFPDTHVARRHRARGPKGSEQKRHMPHLRIRLPEALLQAANELAAEEETSWQEIARQALEEKVQAARRRRAALPGEEVVAV
jgi:hypothetical protein